MTRRVAIPALMLVGSLATGAASAQPAVQTGYATMDDGTRLYYEIAGDGEEVVVVPMAMVLSEALAPLADGRRIVFYDPRNRGRSDTADLATVSLDRQVLDLDQLRSALGIDRMALIGWSGLGMEMAVYAIRRPERVTRLVQVSAVPPSAALMAEFGDRRSERVDQAAVEAVDSLAEVGAIDSGEHCRRRRALTAPASFADWRPELRDLTIPRLVIHGREDGIPLEGGRAWAAGFPTARLLVLSPAGHFPFLEQPAAFFPAVDRFLDGAWPEEAVLIEE